MNTLRKKGPRGQGVKGPSDKIFFNTGILESLNPVFIWLTLKINSKAF